MGTNHLLEKTLKLALIYKSTEGKQISSANSMAMFNEPTNKYDRKVLYETICECHAQGIISDEIKELLLTYKDLFRNSYFHAEAKKTFGGAKMRFMVGNFF